MFRTFVHTVLLIVSIFVGGQAVLLAAMSNQIEESTHLNSDSSTHEDFSEETLNSEAPFRKISNVELLIPDLIEVDAFEEETEEEPVTPKRSKNHSENHSNGVFGSASLNHLSDNYDPEKFIHQRWGRQGIPWYLTLEVFRI